MRTFIGIAMGVVFVGFMLYAALQEARVQCEVCIDFGGRSDCRTSAAVDRNADIQGAVASACALLSSGVTSGIQCSSTPPRSVQCDD
jgi:hypothetical protein